MVTKFDCFHFLDVAYGLKAKPIKDKEEACYRTAIGRIYYVAFLHISRKLWLSGKGNKIGNFSNTGFHEKVIAYLITYGDKNEILLGHALSQLKGLRTQSDYKVDELVDEKTVESALSQLMNIKWIIECKLGWDKLPI